MQKKVCWNRESHSRPCSEPPKIPESPGHIWSRIWRCSVLQQYSLAEPWSSSGRDLLHCFLTSKNFFKEIDRLVATLDTQFQNRLSASRQTVLDNLNKLNTLLQGRQKLLRILYEAVNGFEGKLSLFKVQAWERQLSDFLFAERKSAAKTRRAHGRRQAGACRCIGQSAGQPSTSDSSTLRIYRWRLLLCLPLSLNVCHNMSQTFGVDEAALQEDFIDLKIVPGLKRTVSRCKRRPCAFLNDESAGR